MSLTPELPRLDRAARAAFTVFDVWQAVEKITASEEFGRSDRLGQLLRHIITEELEGRGGRLKAYAIATQVLGRGQDFDSAQDSIVRVEMARLRTALKLFYSRPNDAPVVIDVPKGGYRPSIFPVSPLATEAPAKAVASEMPPASNREIAPSAKGSASGKRWLAMGALGIVAVLGILTGVATRQPRPEPKTTVLPPLVLVSPVTISSTNRAMKSFERGLKGELLGELSAYQWMSVAYRSEAPPASATSEPRSIYTVSMNLVIEGTEYSSVTTLQDAATGRVRWTYSDKGTLPDNQVFPLLAASARRIAAEIAQPLGAVTRAELEETPLGSSAGNYVCLLRLREYSIDWTTSSRDTFHACVLAQGLASDALGHGLSAFAAQDLVRTETGQKRTDMLVAARRDIDAALATRSRSYLVLSTAAQIHACQGDRPQMEAFAADILRSRSNDPTALGHIAAIRAFAFDDRTTALDLVHKAQSIALGPLLAADLVQAVEDFMRGNSAEVVRRLEILPRNPHPAATVLLAAAYGELGDGTGLAKLKGSLAGTLLPDLDSTRAYVANECWSDTTRARLDAALDKAMRL